MDITMSAGGSTAIDGEVDGEGDGDVGDGVISGSWRADGEVSGVWRPTGFRGSRIVPLFGLGVRPRESQTML